MRDEDRSVSAALIWQGRNMGKNDLSQQGGKALPLCPRRLVFSLGCLLHARPEQCKIVMVNPLLSACECMPSAPIPFACNTTMLSYAAL